MIDNMHQAAAVAETAVSTNGTAQSLRIAYMIQNVGIDLNTRIGDAVPVWYTLDGLRKAGHHVHTYTLQGRGVTVLEDVTQPQRTHRAASGLPGKRPFLLFERAVRRLQRSLNLPYFALFDSYRFYDACLRALPAYQLCHEHNGLLSIGTALACKRLRKPYVLTFSADALFESQYKGMPLRGLRYVAAAHEARLTYRLADQILCVSKPAKEHLVNVWQVDPGKITVMPNCVDISRFHPGYDAQAVRARYGLGEAPVITFVGGFQLWHGLDDLVQCFADILHEVPSARLLLVGDGPQRAEIERLAAELGITDAVTITGLLPQEEVPPLLTAADIAVIPYPQLPQELWFSPLKLYEYMAAGKAIVASRAGQIADVIADGETGLLVESGDLAAFTTAVITLLQSPQLRQKLGSQARKQAVHHHSWEQYIQRLERVYQKALQSQK